MCASTSCSSISLALLQKNTCYTLWAHTNTQPFICTRAMRKVYHKIFKNLFQVASFASRFRCSNSMWGNNLWQRLFAHRKNVPLNCIMSVWCESLMRQFYHWFKGILKESSEKMPQRHSIDWVLFCLWFIWVHIHYDFFSRWT
jgi:hypothetical protein